ncbi:MAG: adenylate/guanylate cyclase domain-containing protein, partial [Acidimicrobiia bacterium]
ALGSAPLATSRSPIRYARSGELSIAYQVIGDGPVNIVFVPGFISNLDMMPDAHPYAPLLERLGSIGRCVLFDKRGTGLSDRDLGFGSLEERADDIRTVMDDIGFETASIFGYSEGGPLSVFFAATYPDRVDALALYASFGSLYARGDREARVSEMTGIIQQDWGSGRGLTPFLQGIPFDNEAVVASIARYERGAASPGMAAAILKAGTEIDARALLNSVKAKTLVLHSTGDPTVPVEEGRRLAKGIPGATFIEHEADYHWTFDGRKLWFIDTLVDFLAGERVQPPVTNRFLATVLFTDIVGSTEEVSRQGDSGWARLLERHDQEARNNIDRLGGRLIKTIGDGLLAVFDSPSRAVAAAQAIQNDVGALGLTIRAGVHTGEIEQLADDIAGIGVHIASRVMSHARDGEVWVSRTVRDLTTGSGLEYIDEGPHVLKGVPGEWELYSSPHVG